MHEAKTTNTASYSVCDTITISQAAEYEIWTSATGRSSGVDDLYTWCDESLSLFRVTALTDSSGFPKPDNVALAFHLEAVVRENGGIPASVGMIDGVARVGLSSEELARLCSSAGEASTLKLSRRDLAYAAGLELAGKPLNGGTTVAGTMILAHLAGIKVFATGGLGGVHRGGENSMDVSADLNELGRTPVAVVSSGCKSFLDIPRTIEYLETQGVPVATFAEGRIGKIDFPSFWSRDSGVKSPAVVADEREAAAMIHAQRKLRLTSGLLFGSPIPQDKEIPKAEIDQAINEAIQQAHEAGVSGKDNTPYILSKIWEITRGRSLQANKALVENNVARATKIAKYLIDFEKGSHPVELNTKNYATAVAPDIQVREGNVAEHSPVQDDSSIGLPQADIVVAGAAAVDLACDYSPIVRSASSTPEFHTSNPARISPTAGGVARNIAVAANSLGASVLLCGMRGDDWAGNLIQSDFHSHGLSDAGLFSPGSVINMSKESAQKEQEFADIHKALSTASTAQYVAFNDTKKDLVIAMADMSILEKINSTFIKRYWTSHFRDSVQPKWIILDTNWATEGLATWIDEAKTFGVKVAVDPVSTSKATRLFAPSSISPGQSSVFPSHKLHVLTPNAAELASMHEAARSTGLFETQGWWDVIDSLGIPASGARIAYESIAGKPLVDEGIPQRSVQLLPFCPCIVVKLGAQGVLLTELLPADDERLKSADNAKWIISRSSGEEIGGVYMRLFPAEEVPKEEIKSVNGVGDTFLGTLIAGLAKRGEGARVHQLVEVAQQASRMTLRSNQSVSEKLHQLRTSL
ncbi:MAG: hypothetical protein M1820_004698 [Bogoriella megaspora]|nr:MAG: hypothetical protein M1820_004698 [Bogoriella megaspora]